MFIEYRGYQLDLISRSIVALKNDEVPLIVLPMAGGKTIIMGGIIQNFETQKEDLSVLVLVPSNLLKKQTNEFFNSIGVTAEVETYSEILNKPFRRFDLLLLDEAHHAVSKSWGKFINKLYAENAVGFTATPFRIDYKPLLTKHGGIFSKVIFGPPLEQLTKDNYVAKLKYMAYPLHKVIKKILLTTFLGEPIYCDHTFYEIDKKDIVKEYTEQFNDKSAIVFCNSIEHCKSIVNQFNNAGVLANYVSCYRPTDENEQVIKSVKEGKTKILTTCTMSSEGISIPILKVAIMARPIINSVALYLQQIGRVLRLYENQEAVILDLVGNCYRLGSINNIYKKKAIV